MTIFDYANWFAMVFGFLFFVVSRVRAKKNEVLYLFVVLIILIPFALVSNLIVLFNIVVLVISMTVAVSGVQFPLRSFQSLNGLGAIFLILLFVVPIVFRGFDGWLVLLGTSAKYWFLFSVATIYSLISCYRVKACLATAVLMAGIVWGFKVALLLFVVMLIDYISSSGSIRRLFAFFVGAFLVLVASYIFFQDHIIYFLEESVFRPDYEHDTKIFGLSDGARINIWLHYLENSVWFGKGGFYLPDVVATHNIFVHLANEFGFLGLILIGPVFIAVFFVMARRIGMVFSMLVFITFNFSSVAEYASMWVFCIIVAPILFRSPLFYKKLIFPGLSGYAY